MPKEGLINPIEGQVGHTTTIGLLSTYISARKLPPKAYKFLETRVNALVMIVSTVDKYLSLCR